MPNFFIPFALMCVVLLAVAVVRPRLIYEYPYFMAATFTAFILPQANVFPVPGVLLAGLSTPSSSRASFQTQYSH